MNGWGRDHPRVCGEKSQKDIDQLYRTGSPPRVRGKVHGYVFDNARARITPACAGKSNPVPFRCSRSGDHPRVCGEKSDTVVLTSAFQGSPPRVRGKVEPFGILRCLDGITPACAGKRLKKAHKIKDFDPVPIRFHLVFRRFERWCSNLPTPDGNVPV